MIARRHARHFMHTAVDVQQYSTNLQETAVVQADGNEHDLPVNTKFIAVGVGVRQAGRPRRAVDAHLSYVQRVHEEIRVSACC